MKILFPLMVCGVVVNMQAGSWIGRAFTSARSVGEQSIGAIKSAIGPKTTEVVAKPVAKYTMPLNAAAQKMQGKTVSVPYTVKGLAPERTRRYLGLEKQEPSVRSSQNISMSVDDVMQSIKVPEITPSVTRASREKLGANLKEQMKNNRKEVRTIKKSANVLPKKMAVNKTRLKEEEENIFVESQVKKAVPVVPEGLSIQELRARIDEVFYNLDPKKGYEAVDQLNALKKQVVESKDLSLIKHMLSRYTEVQEHIKNGTFPVRALQEEKVLFQESGFTAKELEDQYKQERALERKAQKDALMFEVPEPKEIIVTQEELGVNLKKQIKNDIKEVRTIQESLMALPKKMVVDKTRLSQLEEERVLEVPLSKKITTVESQVEPQIELQKQKQYSKVSEEYEILKDLKIFDSSEVRSAQEGAQRYQDLQDTRGRIEKLTDAQVRADMIKEVDMRIQDTAIQTLKYTINDVLVRAVDGDKQEALGQLKELQTAVKTTGDAGLARNLDAAISEVKADINRTQVSKREELSAIGSGQQKFAKPQTAAQRKKLENTQEKLERRAPEIKITREDPVIEGEVLSAAV